MYICVRGHVYMCQRSCIYACQRSCIYVLEVIYMCQRSCIYVLEVMYVCQRSYVLEVMYVCQESYMCVRGHVYVCQSEQSCIYVLEVMYICVRNIDVVSVPCEWSCICVYPVSSDFPDCSTIAKDSAVPRSLAATQVTLCLRVFSLGGWSPHIQTAFHVRRLTQFHINLIFVYGTITLYR